MPSQPDSESSRPAAFKNWFDAARYRRIGQILSGIAPNFDQRRFLKLTLDGLEERSLMERLHQTAAAVETALPGTYRQKLGILRELAPQLDHDFVAIFLSDFVAQFGQEDFIRSLEALRFFTKFGSAEFAVRPFLVRDLEKTLQVMLHWTGDADEKVRRLASEGSRPRLPWGLRLQALVADPAPLIPILEAMKNDPAIFVRKSVANSLNDIAKDHPDWVVHRLTSWDRTHSGTAWIAKHAARTLIKRGHPAALNLFGFGGTAKVAATLAVSPATLQLGDFLTLSAAITSQAKSSQRLVIDYVIHYVKSGGGTSAKVFKWKELTLPSGGSATLTKRQAIRDFTIRRHHAGRHHVELQINGRRVAETAFLLRR
jgi:3-methyladenine DNA glycosylase AlkC